VTIGQGPNPVSSTLTAVALTDRIALSDRRQKDHRQGRVIEGDEERAYAAKADVVVCLQGEADSHGVETEDSSAGQDKRGD